MKADEVEIKTITLLKPTGKFTRSCSIQRDDEGYERATLGNSDFLLLSKKECRKKKRGAAVQHACLSGSKYFSSDFFMHTYTQDMHVPL